MSLHYIKSSLTFLAIASEWIEHNDHKSILSKPQTTPPSAEYIWGGTIADLIELAIALYNIKLIRKASGKLITFGEIIHGLKLIFNIKIPKNIYSRKSRTMERKKNSSSMLERLLAVYNHEVDQLYK